MNTFENFERYTEACAGVTIFRSLVVSVSGIQAVYSLCVFILHSRLEMLLFSIRSMRKKALLSTVTMERRIPTDGALSWFEVFQKGRVHFVHSYEHAIEKRHFPYKYRIEIPI